MTKISRTSLNTLSLLLRVDGPNDLLIDMAADEITRLREALAKILDLEIFAKKGAVPLSDAGGIAYRALHGESP